MANNSTRKDVTHLEPALSGIQQRRCAGHLTTVTTKGSGGTAFLSWPTNQRCCLAGSPSEVEAAGMEQQRVVTTSPF